LTPADLIGVTLEPLQGIAFRVVESQEEIATTRLVDDIPEQARLEELLEGTKPRRVPGTEHLHYLLATPFRYPPLRHGSRFGQYFEPSLFYGAMTINTALAETAYYRFLFLDHLAVPFPKPLRTLHTVFGARVRTNKGIRLQNAEWSEHHQALSHPSDYRASQALGSAMREKGVSGFQFLSARARQAGLYSLPFTPNQGLEGVNIGLFDPAALKDRTPTKTMRLIIVTSTDTVSMSLTRDTGTREVSTFERDRFLVQGQLPNPAL